MFLMAGLILAANLCSAQFMVVTNINQPEENAEWETSNFTDNLGVGYIVNDFTVGVAKNGDDYDVWGRYYFSNCYAVVQAPTEETTDNMVIGVGYSFNIWDKLYLDPNYMISTKDDSEGEFKLGVSYKF